MQGGHRHYEPLPHVSPRQLDKAVEWREEGGERAGEMDGWMVGWMEEVRKREEENRKCGGTGKEQELSGKAREQKVSEGKTFVKICVSKHSNTFKC